VADLAGVKPIFLGYAGPIDSGGATRIAAAMNAAVNDGCDEIHFAFSSLGGYVADGVYLYNHMRSLPVRMIAYNTGSVSSIAVVVFVAAETRFCSQHALFMIHPTAMPTNENMVVERLQSTLDATLAEDKRTEAILRERTGLSNEILDARRLKDVHISPAVAVEQGLVQGIAEFTLPKGARVFQI
jgi:ATP-dependent Clp protease protease subunit